MLVLLGLPLATGASLVAFIVFRLPMGPAALLSVGLGCAAWAVVLPGLPSETRRAIVRRARRGAVTAPCALVAYDLTRYGLVALASFSFQPFHVFPMFGHALLGSQVAEPIAVAAGIGFHVANGMGFAIAFALAIARPTVLRGIAWALCLEAAMLLLYPGWLGTSLTGELLPVSLAGHLAYGAVLGYVLARLTK